VKITKLKLKNLIVEALAEIAVKTVPHEQYAADVASLPDSMRDLATGQRETESPRSKHVVGNFFMTKGVPYKPPRGYGRLKKMFNFYMVLPDGEAISIDNPSFQVKNESEAMKYLNLLDQNVVPVTMDNLESAKLMIDQVSNVISMMSEV